MKSRNIIQSFNYAVSGIISALKHEKNMKVHFGIALIVLIASLFFDFTRIEFLMLVITITLVIVAEMFNTAIEKSIDLVTEEYHPLAKLAKDISAGAVLIVSLNSILVGYLLFFDRINSFSGLILLKIKNSPIHVTFITLIVVVILTIILKAIFYRGHGTHFQGGVVSGHSAISFCVATIIAFLSGNMLVTTLSYFLAFLVAESRVEGKIHSLLEVVVGGILGTTVGVLVFQLVI